MRRHAYDGATNLSRHLQVIGAALDRRYRPVALEHGVGAERADTRQRYNRHLDAHRAHETRLDPTGDGRGGLPQNGERPIGGQDRRRVSFGADREVPDKGYRGRSCGCPPCPAGDEDSLAARGDPYGADHPDLRHRVAGLGIAKGQISYISERFTWENTGEWRVGGTTVKGDSLHKVNTTDDLFRLNTKANLRIVPKLFGSFSAEFETRFFPTYKSNSRQLKSGPFSPLRFTLAAGLDFKPVKNLSVSVYPLSYRLTHVHDTARVTVTDYGLKKGERTRHNAGSLIRVEYLWKPVREVALETRFYMFTNYKGVEIDLEVNCDFIINKYLSARVMLHPRYDTDVIMKGDTHAKIQFRELISLGFAHKFH